MMNYSEKCYRYRLETYSREIRKHVCPACGKRTFVRYVDVETGGYVSTDVGRCDREKKCGYHKRPRDWFLEHGTGERRDYFFPRQRQDVRLGTFSTVRPEIATLTMRAYDRNNLMLYIRSLWGEDAARRMAVRYGIGTCNFWPGATVFWQRDIDGRFRTGKIMLYDCETGHRVKEPTSKVMWVHRLKMFSDFHLRQCLFGEHLLKDWSGPVAVVESEKTAAIASLFFQDAVFLATGGLNNLQADRLRCLGGRRIVLFPDLGAEEQWRESTQGIPELRDARVSTWLMNNCTEVERTEGLDIGDWLVRMREVRGLRVEEFM